MENIRLINLPIKTSHKRASSREASMLQVNDACDLLFTCLMLAAFDWVLLLNVTEQNPQLLIIKGAVGGTWQAEARDLGLKQKKILKKQHARQ